MEGKEQVVMNGYKACISGILVFLFIAGAACPAWAEVTVEEHFNSITLGSDWDSTPTSVGAVELPSGDGNYRLMLQGGENTKRDTGINWTNYTKATLKFDYAVEGLSSASESAYVDFYYSGSWHSEELQKGPHSSLEWWGAHTIEIPEGTTKFRFRLGATSSTAKFYVDNILITALPTPPAVGAEGSTDGLGSHTSPTFLFTAAYDWLQSFHDYNSKATRGGNQTDQDTDNFNKIIVVDSSLFPIMTSIDGDNEFPNITSRNTATWDSSSKSKLSPSVNDYFNRTIAVAPDFIKTYDIPYLVSKDSQAAYDTSDYDRTGIEQYGARSFMQWAFITDPGNHNIRRYEFQKLADFHTMIDAEIDISGMIQPSPENVDMHSVCTPSGSGPKDTWLRGKTTDVLKKWTFYNNPPNQYENDMVLWSCKHAKSVPTLDSISDLVNYIKNGSEDGPYPYLEFFLDLPDTVTPLKLTVYGNARDQSSKNLIVGINSNIGDNPTGVYPAASQFQMQAFDHTNNSNDRDEHTYEFTINDTFDLDGTPSNGIQLRVRLYAMKLGGFAIDKIQVGEDDSAFVVKRNSAASTDDAIREARWNDIGTYLETVPPESYPGYPTYTATGRRSLGYGFETNTSFGHAKNIRFKNPRDVDVYRDVFDESNDAPTYVFVADTMNSRIQVFMNATGSAGATGADFPIRPVRVKGPNDTTTKTAFVSNELGYRILSSDGSSTGFGDGRKADWRQSLSPSTKFENVTTGKGEFYYPHGIAVDQDPDTKDVYLFVADTFNHRIQVFRDTTGVTSQSITDKEFDFKFEKGWGAYPSDTSKPGAFNFRYPKGLDIARFSNNSSYLYVVDSKNYRVLKYLITEDGNGLRDPEIVAGYGYDGTSFSRTLTELPGVPQENYGSFEDEQLAVVGFLNPQDVSTGYSGFYTYSGPNAAGTAYTHELDRGTSLPKRGIRYLNNYLVYVTDYARNDSTIKPDRMNMRVMQFADNYQTITGSFLPWKTESVTFNKGTLEQYILGSTGGVHQTGSTYPIPGPAENAGKDGYFSDRPVGITALTWDTITPIDMRVMNLSTSTVYSNGATIPKGTNLRVGVRTQGYFGLPYSDINTYTEYMASTLGEDGKGIKRVHVFCYDPDGEYVGHKELTAPPYEFTPSTDISSKCNGYMKIIAEDKYFTNSGKTGTMIFNMTD
jgi:hypothetical protein